LRFETELLLQFSNMDCKTSEEKKTWLLLRRNGRNTIFLIFFFDAKIEWQMSKRAKKNPQPTLNAKLRLTPELEQHLRIIQREEGIAEFVFEVEQSGQEGILTVDCSINKHGGIYRTTQCRRFEFVLSNPEQVPREPMRLNFAKHIDLYESKVSFLRGLLPHSGRNDTYWAQVDSETQKLVKSNGKSVLERSVARSFFYERQLLKIIFDMAGWSHVLKETFVLGRKRPRD